jgi:hypothetical protein
MRVRYTIALWTVLIMALAVIPARAIVYVSTDFPTLVADARAIAVGRVVALEARWNDGRHGIETLVTVEVEQYLKGDLGTAVTVRTPGGQIGPYLSMMPGAPRFAEGDEVVLFLAGSGPALPHVLGLGQGVFRIVVDGAGRRVVVPEMLSAASQVPAPVVRGDLLRRPAPLDRFAAEVKTLVVQRSGR